MEVRPECPSALSGVGGKQISLPQTTPSQRRGSLLFHRTAHFHFRGRMDLDSQPFRLSKLPPLSQTRHQTPRKGHGAVWRPNRHLSLESESQCHIGRKRIGFPEDTSLKQFPFEDAQENWMLPRGCVSFETPSVGRKRLPDRLDRSKDPLQGIRVSRETSSRARHTLRFGF